MLMSITFIIKYNEAAYSSLMRKIWRLVRKIEVISDLCHGVGEAGKVTADLPSIAALKLPSEKAFGDKRPR